MTIAFMLNGMMRGKTLDIAMLVNMLAAILVCVAIALWVFAVVRFAMSSEDRGRATALPLVGFPTQVALIVLAAVIDSRSRGQLSTALVLGTAAVLSIANVGWALQCSSIIGSRMKLATLFWIAGGILAFAAPQH
jgi:hypothetical protein